MAEAGFDGRKGLLCRLRESFFCLTTNSRPEVDPDGCLGYIVLYFATFSRNARMAPAISARVAGSVMVPSAERFPFETAH